MTRRYNGGRSLHDRYLAPKSEPHQRAAATRASRQRQREQLLAALVKRGVKWSTASLEALAREWGGPYADLIGTPYTHHA